MSETAIDVCIYKFIFILGYKFNILVYYKVYYIHKIYILYNI